jgi:hypothetical protein
MIVLFVVKEAVVVVMLMEICLRVAENIVAE